MFEQQERKLAEAVKSATEVTNKRIDKLSADIVKFNENVIDLTNDANGVEDNIEALQEIIKEIMENYKKKQRQKNKEMSIV